MIESDVRKPVEDYAKKRGFIVIGLHLSENSGWPDIVCLGQHRKVFFIEFKRPGQKLRRLQDHRRKLLRKFGFASYGPVDSIKEGKKIVDLHAA